MMAMGRVVVCLLAVILTVVVSYAESRPVQGRRMVFSLPYNCIQGIPGKKENAKSVCLADSFKPGLNVVLVSKKGSCSAKTAKTFTDGPLNHKATRLLLTQECAALGAAEENRRVFAGFYIAVVGADPAAVSVVPVMDDRSPVPKEIEQKARKLAARHIEKPHDSYDDTEYPVTVSDAKPTVLRAENVTLLTYELQVTYGSEAPIPWEPGPTVAWTNTGVFLLDGACTYGEPKFFSVNNRLHLTYSATVYCCGCGDTNFFVYDLSDESPELVYHNSDFSI